MKGAAVYFETSDNIYRTTRLKENENELSGFFEGMGFPS
jgi:hypothetical protein